MDFNSIERKATVVGNLIVPAGNFYFGRDTGAKAAPKMDWAKAFAGCKRVIDVKNQQELERALASLEPRDGIRLADGLYESTAQRSIRQPNVVFGPKNPGVQHARGVTINKGQVSIESPDCLFGGVRVTSTTTAMPDFFRVAAERTQLRDLDIADIKTKSPKTRVLVIENTAHDSSVMGALFSHSTGYTAVLDIPKSGGFAKNFSLTYSDFEHCTEHYFQAGQWGVPADSNGLFAFNSIRDCQSAELKVSKFQCLYNDFYNVERGFNLRIGDGNTIAHNRFVGGRRCTRVFGGKHRIAANIMSEALLYSIILCEGSLPEQFRKLPNAHHVVAHNIEISDNVVYTGKRGGILVGDQQTGMLGTGNRAARSPNDRQWPHYEPYSPQGVNVVRNVFFANGGRVLALRRPDTRPHRRDRYPEHPSLGKYKDVSANENTIFLSRDAVMGHVETEEFLAWEGRNIVTPVTARR